MQMIANMARQLEEDQAHQEDEDNRRAEDDEEHRPQESGVNRSRRPGASRDEYHQEGWDDNDDDREERLLRKLEARMKLKEVDEKSPLVNRQPFSKEIMNYEVPAKADPPAITKYSGTTDPMEHIKEFNFHMMYQGAPDALRCRTFPLTLEGMARDWFLGLAPESITSFPELVAQFEAHFVSSKKPRKTSFHLLNVRQGPNESLRAFLTRFHGTGVEVEGFSVSLAVTTLLQTSRNQPFKDSLSKNQPATIADLKRRGEKYINMEEARRLSSEGNKAQQEEREGRERKRAKAPGITQES